MYGGGRRDISESWSQGHLRASARAPRLFLILKNKEVLWPQLSFFIDFLAKGNKLECQVRRARLCPQTAGCLLPRHNLSALPAAPKACLFLSLFLTLDGSQMGSTDYSSFFASRNVVDSARGEPKSSREGVK